MPLEIKWKEFFKFSFIFSILLFLLCLQTLTFQDVFSTTNKYLKSTNESSLTNNIKKDFTNINNTKTQNSTLINKIKL